MIEDARYQRRLAQIHCEEMDAQIRNRAIVAPHDGIIVDVLKKTGETVIAGQPVFHVVKADRLRVTAYSNLADYTRIRAGQRVEISPETDALDPDILRRKFEGKVLVDKAASIPNRKLAGSSQRSKTMTSLWPPASKCR